MLRSMFGNSYFPEILVRIKRYIYSEFKELLQSGNVGFGLRASSDGVVAEC